VTRPKCTTANYICSLVLHILFNTTLTHPRTTALIMLRFVVPIHMMFPCFPVLPFPPMRFGPALNFPVLHFPPLWFGLTTCVFHPRRIFHGPAFSIPAFSASPSDHYSPILPMIYSIVSISVLCLIFSLLIMTSNNTTESALIKCLCFILIYL